MENYNGTSIYFNKIKYEGIIAQFGKAIPLAKKVCVEYEKLNMGPVDKEVFNNILTTGIKDIETSYAAFVESEITRQNIQVKSQRESMRTNIDADLTDLASAIKELKHQAHWPNIWVDLKLLEICNGSVILSQEAIDTIKKNCSIVVQDTQAYGLLIEIKDAIVKAVRYFENVGYDIARYHPMVTQCHPMGDIEGFLNENKDRTVEINVHRFDWFQKKVNGQMPDLFTPLGRQSKPLGQPAPQSNPTANDKPSNNEFLTNLLK